MSSDSANRLLDGATGFSYADRRKVEYLAASFPISYLLAELAFVVEQASRHPASRENGNSPRMKAGAEALLNFSRRRVIQAINETNKG